MLDFLVTIDFAVLRAVQWAITFSIELFSWSRVWIERGLMIANAISMISMDASIVASEHAWTGWMLALVVVQSVMGFWMWTIHTIPESSRVIRLLSADLVIARVGLICFVPMFTFLVFYDSHTIGLFRLAGHILLVVFIYACSLPNGGEKGKKRKMAIEKLKEMFGTSWMPEACPQPV